MKGINSDVLALAAVLGSAAVAGVVTLALVSGHGSEEYAYECIVTEVETAPHLMLSLSTGGSSIVVAPDVSLGTSEACENVHVERLEFEGRHLDRAHERMDRAQERVERSRRVVVDRLERVERGRRVDLSELRERIERSSESHEGEMIREMLKTRIVIDGVEMERVEEEMKRVEEELKRRRRRRPGRGGN